MDTNQLRNLLPDQGEAYLINNFFNKAKSSALLTQLTQTISWEQREIKMFGKLIMQPRLMCWMGDEGSTYKYSGTLFRPSPWSKEVHKIKNIIEDNLGYKFNSVLLNLYRDQTDSMGPHSDNERELGPNPIVASLSLGENRRFIFRHKSAKQKVEISLPSGSLLIMKGATQDYWKHELPKSKVGMGPRINLTFRKIVLSGK